MGRIRSIKPEFFTDEELSALDAETHLFAAGLLCYADDFGYFNANPKLAGASIFPVREIFGSVPEFFRRLQTIGFIRLGTTPDGKRWGHIVKFDVHQRVSHPTPSRISTLQVDWNNSGKIPEDSGEFREASIPRARAEGKGREGKGMEQRQIPSPRKKAKSEPKHSTDPRHIACKEEIFAYYRDLNGGADPGWDGREGRALGMLLSANPKLTSDGLHKLLGHRSRSQVNHSERPAIWLGILTSYRNGPLDKYNKPLTIGAKSNGHNGKGNGNLAALERVLAEDSDGFDTDGDFSPGDDGRGDLKTLLTAAGKGVA